MKRLLISLAILGASACGCAQNYGQDITLKLWDNTSAPHSNQITEPEREVAPHRPAFTSEATLFLFRADPEKSTGQALLLCPGGGYQRLAMDHEGFEMAQWFASQGVTVGVLKYRMPNGHPEVPLEDAEEGLRTLRRLASEWGYDPEQVGIAGCSAGGHLAAMCSTMGSVRPAFAILFYPVITGEEGYSHRGSFDNLLGSDRSDALSRRYWLEERVDSITPPTLLFHSEDDHSVPPVNSLRYHNALKQQGISTARHTFPTGGHGWGIRDSFTHKAEWQQIVVDWLETATQCKKQSR